MPPVTKSEINDKDMKELLQHAKKNEEKVIKMQA